MVDTVAQCILGFGARGIGEVLVKVRDIIEEESDSV